MIARLHVVDGTYELFRAHFSKRPDHRGPDGQELKAVVGLVSSMLWLAVDREEAMTHVALAFDNPIESFRNQLFDGYKTGDGVPPELMAQFGPAEDAMRALGMTVWSMDRWEADDALATAAARFVGDVEQVRILTPDKDLGQCLRGSRVVQVDRVRQKVIDEAALRARRGIRPESIPDWLALVGDDADGIPGLPGFGERTATTLLARWIHLDAIPADPRQWEVELRGAPALAATLSERRDDALLYRKLATLIFDVPLAESLADLEWRGAPRARFEAWCDKVGMEALKTRPEKWAPAD